jgi:hypothetical protein
MRDVTNIDIVMPVPVYRNLKTRDVRSSPGMVR